MKALAVTIDGRTYSVEAEGRNLLDVCLSLGFDLPYFCWHPAMHSVGACRQCAVKLYKDEADAKGMIVMACMTPVADGMRVSIDDPEARAARAKVTELLMVNHPHDCPICDEGGECHLQDMTVMTGHVRRSYRFTKRTHGNQDLGPFLNHEMNRCIQCYRCVRFYRDYAGGRDFAVLGWHDNVYFGRHAEGALENEFSGNLVEVCPTGVFTDKTSEAHYARKWDLQTAPSVCVHCGVGCNTIPGERYGLLRRIRTRYNGEVNGYFLCDRGRYGYEFVNGEKRIRGTLARENGRLAPTPPEEALARAASVLRGAKAIGIGSPRASLETNFALRDLVGSDNFFLGVSDSHAALLHAMSDLLAASPVPIASVRRAAAADAVLVLGEDAWNTAPILGLALRQASWNAPMAAEMKEKRIGRWDDAALREAVQKRKGPVFIAAAEETRLDERAAEVYRAAPDDIARLGFAVARQLDPAAPEVPGLSEEIRLLAKRIAGALRDAERPLLVSGAGLESLAVARSAVDVASALKKAGRDAALSLVFPEANSLGAALLAGGGIESAARALEKRGPSAVIAAEADLFRAAEPGAAELLLRECSHLIAIDHTVNATTERAEIVLPAATFAESSGTFVSSEGRAQRFFAGCAPAAPIQDAWRWLGELAQASGRRARAWENLDEVISALLAEFPGFRGVRDAAPSSDFRMNGRRIPRKSLRETGRTAVTANVDVREPAPPIDADSPLAWTMEGRAGQPPSSLIPRFWAPGWNSDQSLHKFQIEVGGPLRDGDPGVRLFEPPAVAAHVSHGTVPPAFAARDGLLLLVPRHHLFGSEELSALSPGIARRSPAPYIAMGRQDAERFGVREGKLALVSWQDAGAGRAATMRCTVVMGNLPPGIAAAPRGIPGMTGVAMPAFVRVTGVET